MGETLSSQGEALISHPSHFPQAMSIAGCLTGGVIGHSSRVCRGEQWSSDKEGGLETGQSGVESLSAVGL